MELYLGESMGSIWNENSSVTVDGKVFKTALNQRYKRSEPQVFFIPAQRVLMVHEGWPRPFQSFKMSDPFVLKDFSERIRQIMEQGLGSGQAVFPQQGRLKQAVREQIENAIFPNAKLRLDRQGLRKQLVLDADKTQSLPLCYGLLDSANSHPYC